MFTLQPYWAQRSKLLHKAMACSYCNLTALFPRGKNKPCGRGKGHQRLGNSAGRGQGGMVRANAA